MTTEQVSYQPFPKLTGAFVAGRLKPGWKDLLWTATNHWLDAKTIAKFADELASDDVRVEVATAAIDGAEAALRSVLEREAATDETPDASVRERWMRVAVAWLYENRETYTDPWAVIEEVWEAFGHPESLNGLIRWMPPPPGGKPGEAGMLERWRDLAASQ